MDAVAIKHALVMTAPDNPAFENNPSDWNADLVTSGAGSVATRIPVINGAGTGLESSANLTFNGTILSAKGLTVTDAPTFSALTSGRVVLVGTSGVITDDAGFTYNTTTDVLQANGLVGSTKNGGIAFSVNVANDVGFGRNDSTGDMQLYGGAAAASATNANAGLSGTALTLSSALALAWSSTTNAGNSSKDTGISRTAAGEVTAGNGTNGNATGTFRAAAYKVGATAGADFSGAVTNITVVKGIVTAAS